jgi:hypothetical protein
MSDGDLKQRAAVAALQGLVAGGNHNPQDAARKAVELADALVKELHQQPKRPVPESDKYF